MKIWNIKADQGIFLLIDPTGLSGNDSSRNSFASAAIDIVSKSKSLSTALSGDSAFLVAMFVPAGKAS